MHKLIALRCLLMCKKKKREVKLTILNYIQIPFQTPSYHLLILQQPYFNSLLPSYITFFLQDGSL